MASLGASNDYADSAWTTAISMLIGREEGSVSTGLSPQPSSPAFCGRCGGCLQSNGKFCPKCGAGVATTPATAPHKEADHASDDITELEVAVTEHPSDESYKKLLAVALHDEALKNWWLNPTDNSLVCVSHKGIVYARNQLVRANQLQFNDPSLRKHIEERLQLVNSMEERKFAGSWLMVIVLGFFYVIPGVIWWYVNRRPLYLINKDYMWHHRTGKHSTAAAKMGGLQGMVYDFFEGVSGQWGWLLGLFFMLTIGVLLSPFFMILAYKQNYVDVKKELA